MIFKSLVLCYIRVEAGLLNLGKISVKEDSIFLLNCKAISDDTAFRNLTIILIYLIMLLLIEVKYKF